MKEIRQVTFTSSTTSSELVLPKSECVVGVICPIGIGNSGCTFLASFDGGSTFMPVNGVNGTTIGSYVGFPELNAVAESYIPIDPRLLAGVERLKLKVVNSMTATIKLVTRPVS